MKEIKELVAWGGVDIQDLKKALQDSSEPCTKPWEIDSRVFKFVQDGYIRGWGMSGGNVDLDLGTAIFARRADVARWNNACVEQIERVYCRTSK